MGQPNICLEKMLWMKLSQNLNFKGYVDNLIITVYSAIICKKETFDSLNKVKGTLL